MNGIEGRFLNELPRGADPAAQADGRSSASTADDEESTSTAWSSSLVRRRRRGLRLRPRATREMEREREGEGEREEDLEPPPMDCITKVVEDEHDEQGRPRVKIIYMDPLDWSTRADSLISRHQSMIEDAEIEKAEELNEGAKPGEVFKPARLIFVLQAQEYWP
ncbi:hypothetical protein L1049_022819 [Liquidambar formosana]|uniref:Uncharacterized protein n=1 Tax=Liquidambar formosana TaxID=63359 RepID=A0AAP0REF8_LIQFO